MAKTAKTFRLSDEAIQIIDTLSKEYEATQVEIVEQALKEFFTKDAAKKLKAVELYLTQIKLQKGLK